MHTEIRREARPALAASLGALLVDEAGLELLILRDELCNGKLGVLLKQCLGVIHPFWRAL